MNNQPGTNFSKSDETPGQEKTLKSGLVKYAVGLGLSLVLTLASFWSAGTATIWAQGLPVLLAALAIAQMGVHLVFFLHISSGPEGTNNIIALAFGVFIVALVVFGSIIIMVNLDANMRPMGQMLEMQK